MSYRKIQAALDRHLQTFNGMQLIFPSTTYRPKYNTAFAVARFLPGSIKTVLLGPDAPKLHRGSYEITIHEKTVQAALARVDELIAHFQAGLTLEFEAQTVSIETPSLGVNRRSLKNTNIPLSINWRSYF